MRVSSRRGSRRGAGARRPALRPGLAFMTLHFPDEVDTNVLTIDATDPEVGHGRVQGAPRSGSRSSSPARPRRAPERPAARPGARDRRMDLQLLDAQATAAERAAVDACWPPAPAGRAASATPPSTRTSRRRARRRASAATCCCRRCRPCRSASAGSARARSSYVCARLTVPPADAYGVATFYALLSRRAAPAPGRPRLRRPRLPCHGAEALIAELEERFGPEGTVGAVGDLGVHVAPEPVPRPVRPRAGRARHAARATRPPSTCSRPSAAHGVLAALDGAAVSVDPAPRAPQRGDPALRLLRRVGVVDPTSLDDYRAHGGYRGAAPRLRARARGRDPRGRRTRSSMGRGGAAFPTGRKWEAVARAAARPHYLSATPTSPSRARSRIGVLLEGDPFALIEAMTIAGVRDRLRARLRLPARRVPAGARARSSTRSRGPRARASSATDVLGQRVRVRHRDPEGRRRLHLRRGDGDLQLDRGPPRRAAQQAAVPRRRRASSASRRVVNNVETLVNVLDDRARGRRGARGASAPTDSTGHEALLPLAATWSGPGVYEVEFGATLRELLELAGGVPGGRALQAVLARRRRRAFVTPTSSTCRSRSRRTRAGRVRSARAS